MRYVRYQGLDAISYFITRSNGMRSDRYEIKALAPPNWRLLVADQEQGDRDQFVTRLPEEEADPYGKETFDIKTRGDLVLVNDKQKVTLSNLFIGEEITDIEEEVVYKDGSRRTVRLLSISLVDVRYFWEQSGYVSGEYNVVTRSENDNWIRIGDEFYKVETVYYSGSKARKEYGTYLVGLYTLMELIDKCISALPSGFNDVSLARLWGPGILIDGQTMFKSDEIVSDKDAEPLDINNTFPENISWDPGTNAAQALGDLLDMYGLELSLLPGNEVMISRQGFGFKEEDVSTKIQSKESITRPYLISEEKGVELSHVPPTFTVVGKKVRQETIISDWVPVMANEQGEFESMSAIISRWGLTDSYVKGQVTTVLQKGKSFVDDQGKLGAKDDFEYQKRQKILRDHAYKSYMIGFSQRDKLPLKKLIDIEESRDIPGYKEKDVRISGFFPYKKTNKENEGNFGFKWFDNALDDIASINLDKGIVTFKVPVGVMLPITKEQGFQDQRCANETRELIKVRIKEEGIREKGIRKANNLMKTIKARQELVKSDQESIKDMMATLAPIVNRTNLFQRLGFSVNERKDYKSRQYWEELISQIEAARKYVPTTSDSGLEAEQVKFQKIRPVILKLINEFEATFGRSEAHKALSDLSDGLFGTSKRSQLFALEFVLAELDWAIADIEAEKLRRQYEEQRSLHVKLSNEVYDLRRDYAVMNQALMRFTPTPIFLLASYEREQRFKFTYGFDLNPAQQSTLLVDTKIMEYRSLGKVDIDNPNNEPSKTEGVAVSRVNQNLTAKELLTLYKKYLTQSGQKVELSEFIRKYSEANSKEELVNSTPYFRYRYNKSNRYECEQAAMIDILSELQKYFPPQRMSAKRVFAGWVSNFTCSGRINSMTFENIDDYPVTTATINRKTYNSYVTEKNRREKQGKFGVFGGVPISITKNWRE